MCSRRESGTVERGGGGGGGVSWFNFGLRQGKGVCIYLVFCVVFPCGMGCIKNIWSP